MAGLDVEVGERAMFRTLVLGSIDTSEVADRHADLVIEPEVSGHGLTDFGRIDRLIAAGREATERVIQVRGDDALAGMGLG
jgi:predicted acylesterase/phospholipase RssA